jgi:hypothetical protein
VNDKEIESPKQSSKLLLWVAFFALVAVAVLIRFWR